MTLLNSWLRLPRLMLNGHQSKGLVGPILIILILSMMVLPLPPFLLDLLFTFNIALSIMVLLVSMYTMKALDFAAFPVVLLFTTLLRLSLNVASTRVVLMEGHTGPDAAGKVIEAFGHFCGGRHGLRHPGGHQLHGHHQGRGPNCRSRCTFHAGCDAGQANGHRRRPQCRPDR
jgi:flagellar biosynthesis protein FlhA